LSAATARLVQRWEGPEHERIGDATGATIDLGHGVVLTWGQVIAVAGDEYGDIDELRRDMRTPAGRRRLHGRLHHALQGHVRLPAPLPTSTQADLGDNSRYNRLAMENVPHFAAGGTAIETWRRHHGRALERALIAGLDDDDAAWEEAQLTEAFGQHFLTDAFSAGHARTPRQAIISWYQDTFAPRVASTLVNSLSRELVRRAAEQLARQNVLLQPAVLEILRVEVQRNIAIPMALAVEALTPTLGLAISGAVSGALHDADNRVGLRVASAARREGWNTFGDGGLGPPGAYPPGMRDPSDTRDSPESRNEMTQAVLAARNQLVEARSIGRAERLDSTTVPTTLPQAVYFAFDDPVLREPGVASIDGAAAYLAQHPEASVSVIGYADPVGEEPYNEGLSARRANGVVERLLRGGAATMQVGMSARGERERLRAIRLGSARIAVSR
jgi:outer membrane protein OmpA-like peptidoglycan-associated protein